MPPALSEIQRKHMATCTKPDGINSIVASFNIPYEMNFIVTTYTGPDGINSIPTTCAEPTVLIFESRRDGSSCNRGFNSVDMRYEIRKEFGEKSCVSNIDWTIGKGVVIHRMDDTFERPHEPTLKPKACKRAAILLTHQVNI